MLGKVSPPNIPSTFPNKVAPGDGHPRAVAMGAEFIQVLACSRNKLSCAPVRLHDLKSVAL